MLILDWASFTLGFICGVSIAFLILIVAGYMYTHALTQTNTTEKQAGENAQHHITWLYGFPMYEGFYMFTQDSHSQRLRTRVNRNGQLSQNNSNPSWDLRTMRPNNTSNAN